MRICFIVGARPNFMKAAPVFKVFESQYDCTLIHTGQHFDENMSDVFFEQLNIKTPDFHLGINGSTQIVQIADVMVQLEKVFNEILPDWVFVFGDVNSTLSAALVAKRCNTKIAHVESGLRSFDNQMPEEMNRILVDRISDLLFVTEPSGVENLINEGYNKDIIKFVGNTMIDSLVDMEKQIDNSSILEDLFLRKEDYIVLTLHRPSNVDGFNQLSEILNNVQRWSGNKKIIWPKHPRIDLKKIDYDKEKFQIMEPIGYIEFIKLVKSSCCVFTDSGGIQEETSFLGVKCFTLRENTERPITISHGTNTLIDQTMFNVTSDWIERSILEIKNPIKIDHWDGKASDRILDIFNSYVKIK